MTYRIGKPLDEGQSPLVVRRYPAGVVRINVYRPDGAEVVGVDVTSDIWPDHIAPAIAALNKRIAGWPVGPFTLDDLEAAA